MGGSLRLNHPEGTGTVRKDGDQSPSGGSVGSGESQMCRQSVHRRSRVLARAASCGCREPCGGECSGRCESKN